MKHRQLVFTMVCCLSTIAAVVPATAKAATEDSDVAVASSTDCVAAEHTLPCVEYVRNYDADTLTVNIRDAHPLFGREIPVRVRGIDTPEMRGGARCEKELAIKARDVVAKMLRSARRIDLVALERDKYFRVLADVMVDGRSLGELLLERRLAVGYDGGTKRLVDWCRMGSS